MKIRCDYCGGYLSDTDEKCPHCGGVNQHLVRGAEGIPQTMEELKAFCQARQLPLEKMRFFIGEDYRQPKAFGIYQDSNGDFVVYKNKADGSRTVRYRGKDEAYAVHELYQKMKSEVLNRKAQGAEGASSKGKNAQQPQKLGFGCTVSIVLVLAALLACFIIGMIEGSPAWPHNGYYLFNNDYYYYQDNDWYTYTNDSWTTTSSVDSTLSDHAESYWEGSSYTDEMTASSFENSDYYQESESQSSWSSSDWDSSDWDYDYSSWDSSDTDWDSDW